VVAAGVLVGVVVRLTGLGGEALLTPYLSSSSRCPRSLRCPGTLVASPVRIAEEAP
jgi:uncharacterized membrane protein YfcA